MKLLKFDYIDCSAGAGVAAKKAAATGHPLKHILPAPKEMDDLRKTLHKKYRKMISSGEDKTSFQAFFKEAYDLRNSYENL